jgi:hypothetical protein
MAGLRRCVRVSITLVILTQTLSLAAQGVNFAGGTGEPNDPYLVATVQQLLAVGWDSTLATRCFKLMADIDLTGLDSSTAVVPTFSGTFDGNGHVIRNLRLTGFGSLGLFGSILSGGRVLNLSLSDADILSAQYAGALAGQNAGFIQHCDSTGSVVCLNDSNYGAGGLIACNTGTITDSRSTADARGYSYVGGLAGSNSGTVSNCTSAGFVFGNSYVGSLVGSNAGIVSASYSDGNALGYQRTGGLVGDNVGTVTNCYSTGSAAGYSSVGGLVGYNSNPGLVSCCYSTASATSRLNTSVGYLLGSTSRGNCAACYYVPLHPILGATVTAAGTKLTAEQIQQRINLVDWDFWGDSSDGAADVWFMPPNGFPVLSWQTDVTGLLAIPDVAGLSLNEAKAALVAAGFVPGAVTEDYHRSIPAGNVIWACPRSFALPGSTIHLVLSKNETYDWARNPGDGTVTKPYQIQSPGQLESLGDHPELWNRCFVLTADLDMGGRTYATALIAPDVNDTPGFQGTAFTGSFNGDTHAILNLRIVRDSSMHGTYVGLFGRVGSIGRIDSLSLKNVTVSASASISGTYVGTLAGLSEGTIVRCTATGVITADYKATVGGLVGYVPGSTVYYQTNVVIIRPDR